MKNAKQCPKCKSIDIVRIPSHIRGHATNNIAVGRTIFSSVTVTRYLCGSCGYTEEWIDSVHDIARLKAKYAPLR